MSNHQTYGDQRGEEIRRAYFDDVVHQAWNWAIAVIALTGLALVLQ